VQPVSRDGFFYLIGFVLTESHLQLDLTCWHWFCRLFDACIESVLFATKWQHCVVKSSLAFSTRSLAVFLCWSLLKYHCT